MKIRPKFFIGLVRNIILKIRYGKRIDLPLLKVYIHPSTRVEISEAGKISFRASRRIYIDRGGLIRASGGSIEIGSGFFMNQNCMMVSHQSVSIGSEVMFGPGVCVFDSDHSMKLGCGAFANQGYEKSPVAISNNVWIGANSVVTRGCTVSSDTVIAANSVARGHLVAGSVYAGVPTKRVKSLSA